MMEYFIIHMSLAVILFFVVQPLLWVYIDHLDDSNKILIFDEMKVLKDEFPSFFYIWSVIVFLVISLLLPVIALLLIMYYIGYKLYDVYVVNPNKRW